MFFSEKNNRFPLAMAMTFVVHQMPDTIPDSHVFCLNTIPVLIDQQQDSRAGETDTLGK